MMHEPVALDESTRHVINALNQQLDIAMGALADIANSKDMTLEMARRKARRVYMDIQDAIGFMR